MLKFVKIKDQSDKLKFLINFNPEVSSFIVSDIKTKLLYEAELLKKYSYLQGVCVTRAYEFYKELFCTLDSKWNFVSDSYVKELFFDFCNSQSESWIKNMKNSKSFFEFFNMFLIVFLYQENLKVFEEWLESRKKNLFWRNWFQFSQKFFEFLEKKKILNESGVKALLLYNLSSVNKLFFNKSKIAVDLSFSLDLCEKEIFNELARHKEVYILAPDLKYRNFFENKFDIYENWEKDLDKKQIIEYSSENSMKTTSQSLFKIKTETQIEEVKKAAAQVCQWIKQGIKPDDIVIYAPNMEDYWFILKSYFKKENIPFKKTVYSKLIDFREIKYLLSAVRIHLNLFNFEDLELFYFYKESKKDFIKFKANYFNEPKRDLVKKLLFQDKARNCDQRAAGFDFIQWLLSFWPKAGDESLKDSLLSILQKFTLTGVLSFRSWLRILETELFSKEMEILTEQVKGVSCLSFNAFYSVKSPYIFILGLTEEAVKESSLFFSNESEDILEDLGFPLAIRSSNQKENSMLWFLQSSHYKEIYLSCHSYNFNGDIQTESLLYMMLSDKLFSARETDISAIAGWNYRIKQKSLPEILHDRQDEQVKALTQAFKDKNLTFFPSKKLHLSANSIKTYRQCPFKYAGEKLFFAYRKPDVHREASPLFKGKLAHSLFERVLTEYPELEITKDQIEQMIDNIPFDSEQMIHKKQKLLMQEYLKRILEEFLVKEKDQKKKFPYLKPVNFESEIQAFWNQKEGKLSDQGDYEFKGYLDRVDQDQKTKEYVLRDYKASSAQHTHVSSWIKNEELQLTFYAQALEKGLVKKLSAGRLSAVFYSIYGESFKDKGFEEKESKFSGLMKAGRGHKKAKTALYSAINLSNRFTQEKVKQMQKGKFSPAPIDLKECKTCFYQNWCRVEES